MWQGFESPTLRHWGANMSDEELFQKFTRDLMKMEPTWRVGVLKLTRGINIRRETKELIRMFRMWNEQFWNVFVFYTNSIGIRYRDRIHNHLTLKEAVCLTQQYIREINDRQNRKILEKAVVVDP